MLLGEHAVVYKKPCLVTSVDQRMKLTIKKIEQSELILHATDLGLDTYIKPISQLCTGVVPKAAEYVEHTISTLLKQFPIQGGIEIETHAEFSEKYGFGSSSAATVCAVKGFSDLFSISLTKRQIFDLAYKVVLDIKGVGSGYDIATAVYGGTLAYVGGGGNIEQLNVSELPLVIGYTGIKADTPLLIKEVAKKMEQDPPRFQKIFHDIEHLVILAKSALQRSDWAQVGRCMNEDESLLAQLDVESSELSQLIQAARKSGAWGAKLSGAGGGDCMIALTPNREATEQAIAAAGGTVVKVGTNISGAVKE